MSQQKLAIIFHRFGPYHLARLAAAAARFDLLAVEESAETAEYAWEAVHAAREGFQRVTLLGAGERPARPAAEIGRRLRRLIDGHRPAAVAVPGWSDPAALTALAWGAACGTPVVLMSESTAWDQPRSPGREWVKRRLVRLGAAGLVGGTPHADYLAALGMARERILPGYDAVDNAHFATGADAARARDAETRARLGLPARFFLASSRFLPQKNLPTLLRAFAAYRQQTTAPAWDLVLLGDGPERGTVSALPAELGVADAVHLPGFRQYDELPAYYGLAGAFVHAATSEPWGLVVNEALASGLPVLVSDRCGCASDLVVNGENGYPFDPANPALLATLMERLAAGAPEARAVMGAAGRRHVANWGPETFGRNLARAVELALAAPRRRVGMVDRVLQRALLARADRHAARLLPPLASVGSPG